MTTLNYMLMRPSQHPCADVPFGARSVGHYRYAPHEHSTDKTVDFIQVIWVARGHGIIELSSAERSLGAGQLALYFPGNRHRFFSLDEPWDFRWWTMDGPLAVAVTTALGLTTGKIYNAGPVPVVLFRKLENAIRNMTPTGESRASVLVYELLARAARGHTTAAADPIVLAAVDAIHNEWNNPRMGVDIIAGRLRIHRSSLSRRFHAALGVSPVKYLTNLRVQNALSRLKAGRQAIGDIAHDCGWTDPYYFSRCIRRATGLSPKAFRKH